MKRKFSFSLPPLKIPSRAETRALKEALNGNFDFESTPISPPLSPYINRQSIDLKTEARLRLACAAIVKGYSEDEPEATLNFQPLHATKSVHKNDAATVSKQVRPHGTTILPPTSQHPPYHPQKHSAKPGLQSNEDSYHSRSTQNLSQTNARPYREPAHDSFSPREGQSFPTRKDSVSAIARPPLNPLLMCPPDRPRTAPLDNASDVSSASPKTASTDRHFNYASTAITSAEVTPSHVSKRASNLVLDNESYKAAQSQADAEAAAWMRQELEKRRQYAQGTQAPQPPPSRSSTRGWISDVREFVRPGSSSGVRTPSKGSHSRQDSRQDSTSIRSSSAQGWRSWSGLRRKSSKSSLTEFAPESKQNARTEQNAPETSRKEINLNRELPPLPSLDTWKEPQPSGDQHIASLMRAGKGKTGKSAAVPRKATPATAYRDLSASQSILPASRSMPQLLAPVAVRNLEHDSVIRTEPILKSQVRKIPATKHSKTSSTDSCFSPASSTSFGAQRSVDLNRVTERLEKQESNVDLNKVSERLEKHERLQKSKSRSKSATSLTHQRHLSDSTNQTRPTTRDGRTPNFSRKISIDNHGRIHDPRGPNVVDITALPPMPSKKQGSRLRRVLSKLEISNRSNRQPRTWMDRFEADGIKSGVIVADESAAAPTIKY